MQMFFFLQYMYNFSNITNKLVRCITPCAAKNNKKFTDIVNNAFYLSILKAVYNYVGAS